MNITIGNSFSYGASLNLGVSLGVNLTNFLQNTDVLPGLSDSFIRVNNVATKVLFNLTGLSTTLGFGSVRTFLLDIQTRDNFFMQVGIRIENARAAVNLTVQTSGAVSLLNAGTFSLTPLLNSLQFKGGLSAYIPLYYSITPASFLLLL